MQMNLLIRSFSGCRSCNSFVRSLCRSLSTGTQEEEYAKRNYANNASEYHTVIVSLNAQRRPYLLRHVYDDMLLDAVQPTRDIFHSLILGTTKAGSLDDALYFRNEMRAMGYAPDVALYNFLIAVCGKAKQSSKAIQVLEELKASGAKPNAQTYICLLNSCAAAGKLEQVYSIVRDMTAAGAGLNKFCYAGLIAAHVNKRPIPEDASSKILELVQQSKGWASVDAFTNAPNNVTESMADEELYNLPTAPFAYRRFFLDKQLTVYHAAFHASAELEDIKMMEELQAMLRKDDYQPDTFIVIQTMRCLLKAGDLERGLKVFDDFMESKRVPASELYLELAGGAMKGYTTRGMQIALDVLMKMTSKQIFLTNKYACDLLLIAAKTKVDGFTTANYIWDLAQARNLPLAYPPVDAYYKGLKEFEIPEDDPRLIQVSSFYNKLRFRRY